MNLSRDRDREDIYGWSCSHPGQTPSHSPHFAPPTYQTEVLRRQHSHLCFATSPVDMFTHLFTAFVALIGLNLVSAWHFTPEHADGLYGITAGEEMHLLFEANHTQLDEAQKRSTVSRKSHWKRQGLPSGEVECGDAYINEGDLANCLVQADNYCGVGTVGTGAKLVE